MQNLEQIRARNVLAFAKEFSEKVKGKDGGHVIKKIPPVILNHGLLATLAYSFTEREGWQIVFDGIARHLASPEIAVVSNTVTNRETLIGFLTLKGTTSEVLKCATAETMAWLNYARRFVK